MSDTTPNITIPDDLFDRHFGGADGAADTVVDGAEDLGTDDALLLDGDDADTPEEHDGADLDSVDDDDDTGGSEDGEGDDAVGEGAAKDADDEAPFDRKELDAIEDPAAKAVAERAYRNFQRAFTAKTQELATVRKAAEAEIATAREFQTGYQTWLKGLETQEGGEHHLLEISEYRPELLTEDVLTDFALKQPEAFEAAFARAQELLDDGKARRVFDGERAIKLRDHRDKQQQTTQAQQQASERAAAVERLVGDEAGKAGVKKPEALEVVRDSVDGFLARSSAAGKKVTAADLRAHVAQVAGRLAGADKAARADAAKAEAARQRKNQQAQVRKQAQDALTRRTAPPGTATPGKTGAYVPPERRSDRIGAAVDHFFG